MRQPQVTTTTDRLQLYRSVCKKRNQLWHIQRSPKPLIRVPCYVGYRISSTINYSIIIIIMAITIIEGRQAARLHKLHNNSVAGLNLSPIPWPTLLIRKAALKPQRHFIASSSLLLFPRVYFSYASKVETELDWIGLDSWQRLKLQRHNIKYWRRQHELHTAIVGPLNILHLLLRKEQGLQLSILNVKNN